MSYAETDFYIESHYTNAIPPTSSRVQTGRVGRYAAYWDVRDADLPLCRSLVDGHKEDRAFNPERVLESHSTFRAFCLY